MSALLTGTVYTFFVNSPYSSKCDCTDLFALLIGRVIKDFMIQGGDFVNVSICSSQNRDYNLFIEHFISRNTPNTILLPVSAKLYLNGFKKAYI